MEMLWWTLVIVLFLTSLIGVVVPFIPDTLLLWAGVLLHRFALAAEGYPLLFWIGMAAATLLIIGADLLANLVFVKKYGGDKWTMLAAAARFDSRSVHFRAAGRDYRSFCRGVIVGNLAFPENGGCVEGGDGNRGCLVEQCLCEDRVATGDDRLVFYHDLMPRTTS